jgi:hypothetical protein
MYICVIHIHINTLVCTCYLLRKKPGSTYANCSQLFPRLIGARGKHLTLKLLKQVFQQACIIFVKFLKYKEGGWLGFISKVSWKYNHGGHRTALFILPVPLTQLWAHAELGYVQGWCKKA